MADGPRISPLPLAEWPPEMGPAMEALIPANPRHPVPTGEDRPKGLNALGTLARHPDLAHAFHTLVGHLLFTTTLSIRQRELLVLRVAVLRHAEYEWAQHVVLAKDTSIGPDEIERIASGPDAPGWAPLEQAMLRATDELIADAEISDATWQVLASELDDRQLLDLVYTVGAYELTAMAFNSLKIEFDDDLPH